jgi:nucleotidyltransferase/DNA polymerase involved in DNA repair
LPLLKSYYLGKTFDQLVQNTTKGEDPLPVKDFWRNYKIKRTTNKNEDAQAEVLQSCMNEFSTDLARYSQTSMALTLIRRLPTQVVSSLIWPGLLDLRI